MALSQADKEAQLRAVGWSPSAGDSVDAAWSRTATPADQAAAGGSAPAQTAQGFDQAGFTQQMTQAATPFAQATSGVTAADLAERKRQFDAQLEWTKQMWQQQGLPQLQIQQQAAALAQQEFESQKQIAQQNFQLAQTGQGLTNAATVAGLTGYYNAPQAAGGSAAGLPTAADFAKLSAADQAPYLQYHGANAAADWASDAGKAIMAAGGPAPQAPGAPGTGQGIQTLAGAAQQAGLSGMYNGSPTEAARQYNATQAQQQAQFAASQAQQQSEFGATTGLDYLKTAASLGGPQDYFQQANFLRGASANSDVPTFLRSLQGNIGMPVFNAPGAASGAPAVQSMGGLAGGLTGGASGNSAALGAIGAIGAAGGQALSPQAWEKMNPDEQALFASGMKASGYSMPSFLSSYANSRIGQGAAQAA